MTVRYSVTFEFDLRPPLTHKGTVSGGQPHVCVARATKAAHKALRPVNWSSLVCVLLERLDATDEVNPADHQIPPARLTWTLPSWNWMKMKTRATP
jgi:hypothetical protein